ncbi:glycosyltransferase family protein [Paenibacillus arenosi]|uniref:Streptomycin biosynthesis protein StrF n=1 Tax=Paenibacillus arenosi TaxID=2774142 RepID=A0ABR9AS64_9BACL|nr:glycosyltransferase family protein [Paenibacillus arenosi]MBD8496967.1 streptomycin biosynthesis protein StrF [Paenibacillus arenosi]
MGLQRILFVMCVNDEALFQQAKRQIANLVVPSGFTVELYDVRGAKSMASGYNCAYHLEAAYRIYIHQDTFLIHKGMLYDLIRLFELNPQLGMIGLAGCVELPTNGIWWEGSELVGQVIEHRHDVYQLLRFGHGALESTDYVEVQAVDGLFMATSINLPWRDEQFDGFHFYDSAHSKEIALAGYKVGVPVLQSPWCIHYNGDEFDHVSYERYRQLFVQQYM